MIGLLLLAAGATSLPASRAEFGYPDQDILFDCELREAENAQLAPESWSARGGDVERFGWLLAGSETLRTDPDASIMRDSGSISIFFSQGAYSSFVDWPRRVEFGAASADGPNSQRRDRFKTLQIDLERHRARVAVTNYEWPHGGDDDDEFVTGGYFGDCVIVEGEDAVRQFEDMA